jgi:biopolymer transport protein ExbB/TolQ
MNFWKKLLSVGTFLASGTMLFAQEEAASYSGKLDLVKMYTEGGPFMHIIAALAGVVVLMAIVKTLRLSVKEKFDAKNFYVKLKGYIKNQQYDEAQKVCANFKDKTMGFIFWNGLIAFNDARKTGKKGKDLREILENGFEEASMQKIPEIEAGLFWFDIFGQVATLAGLLGTIFGLVQSFDALGNAPESEKSKLLTSGISTAMGTTALGLIVAIPTMFIKGALQNRAKGIVDEIDEYSVKMVNQVSNSLGE